MIFIVIAMIFIVIAKIFIKKIFLFYLLLILKYDSNVLQYNYMKFEDLLDESTVWQKRKHCAIITLQLLDKYFIDIFVILP